MSIAHCQRFPSLNGPLGEGEPLRLSIDVGYDLPPVVWEHRPEHRPVSVSLIRRALRYIIELSAEDGHWFIFAGLRALSRAFGCCKRQAEELMRQLQGQGLLHRERRDQHWRYYISWLTLPGMQQPFHRSRYATEEMVERFEEGLVPTVRPDSLVRLERIPHEQQAMVDEWQRLRSKRYPEAPPARRWQLPAPAVWVEIQTVTQQAAELAELPVGLAERELLRLYLAREGFGDGKLQDKHHPLSWLKFYLHDTRGPSLTQELMSWARSSKPVREQAEPPAAEAEEAVDDEPQDTTERVAALLASALGAGKGARRANQQTAAERVYARQLELEGRQRAPGPRTSSAAEQQAALAEWMAAHPDR